MTPTEIDLRSYDVPFSDAHDFAQMVLPLRGKLTLDINGHGALLHPLRAAFIAPGLVHTQFSDAPNASLILDFDLAAVSPETAGLLAQRPFAPVSAATSKLIDFMGMLQEQGAASTAVLANWTPLLLESLTSQPLRPASRLQAALTRFEAQPGHPWNTGRMAEVACLSVSRLHRVFREELDTTPQAWLNAMRLRYVCRQLVESSLPIAQLATLAGYADQSALTHAMRRAMDITPLAYRQQNQTKIR
ncbi:MULTISPECIES: AraC family transcriptional regulator [unclassified Duganella]|uniref:AraC family transcriptional regulator n=1 Tax=unclassified Duganella TaxID=2636909 RepID=UPI000880FC13|nr:MULTISPECIES: AraC family transcriptional regulator [unclassified Duganella]SDG69216.1 AraC-type DNA-binding protein [Duganella sp. OV458]SDJ94594.1 transcriptional regulator, AraC family [Duganella sp. OV510]